MRREGEDPGSPQKKAKEAPGSPQKKIKLEPGSPQKKAHVLDHNNEVDSTADSRSSGSPKKSSSSPRNIFNTGSGRSSGGSPRGCSPPSSSSDISPRLTGSSPPSSALDTSPKLNSRYNQSPPDSFVSHSVFAQEARKYESEHLLTRAALLNKEGYHGNIRVHRDRVRKYIGSLQQTPIHEKITKVSVPITIYSGLRLNATLYRPKSTNNHNRWPTIIYMGGNAYTGPDYYEPFCPNLAIHSGAQVIYIQHRLAPDTIFPTPLSDCYEQIKKIVAACARHDDHNSPHNAALDFELSIDPQKLMLAGYSSGATNALIIGLLAHHDRIYFHSLHLFSPVTDFSRQTNESSLIKSTCMHCLEQPISIGDFRGKYIIPQFNNQKQNDDLVVTERFFEFFRSAYVPTLTTTSAGTPGVDNIRYINSALSPIYKTNEELRVIPRTFFWVNNPDRFYNDTMGMAMRLQSIHTSDHVRVIEWDSQFGHGYVWQDTSVVQYMGRIIHENLASNDHQPVVLTGDSLYRSGTDNSLETVPQTSSSSASQDPSLDTFSRLGSPNGDDATMMDSLDCGEEFDSEEESPPTPPARSSLRFSPRKV